MKTTIETITPQIAELMLEKNTSNRSLSAKRVKALSRSISSGEWELNGDSIRFDTNGVLLDGQHRLAAIADSGISVKSLVVTGIRPTAFDTIDQGMKRTSAQILAMQGVKYSNRISVVARLYLAYKTCGYPYANDISRSPTLRAVDGFVTSNIERLEECATRAEASKISKRFLSPGVLTFIIYTFSEHNKYKADSFFDGLENGYGLEKGCPVRALRDRLTVESMRSSRQSAASLNLKTALCFKAFRLYCRGDSALIIKLSKDKHEQFKL